MHLLRHNEVDENVNKKREIAKEQYGTLYIKAGVPVKNTSEFLQECTMMLQELVRKINPGNKDKVF